MKGRIHHIRGRLVVVAVTVFGGMLFGGGRVHAAGSIVSAVPGACRSDGTRDVVVTVGVDGRTRHVRIVLVGGNGDERELVTIGGGGFGHVGWQRATIALPADGRRHQLDRYDIGGDDRVGVGPHHRLGSPPFFTVVIEACPRGPVTPPAQVPEFPVVPAGVLTASAIVAGGWGRRARRRHAS